MHFLDFLRVAFCNTNGCKYCSVKLWYVSWSEKAGKSVGGDKWAGEGFVLFVHGTADVSNKAEILKSLSTT